jgi:23S rRNA (cytidine1920-2'-O)/16S rRNA (cytidine1409-2'-O)-methyltransferase
VKVGDSVIRKAGELVDEAARIIVAERRRFVSRGGDKLAGALSEFALPIAGRRAVDVGASTGGFTDCLLQGGAASVTAVDVGYGQLAWSLRTDPRVTVFERTNIRHADPTELGGPFDLVVADVSFISLRTVLPALVSLMGEGADVVALVKPQFEAGKGRVGKRGVVKDAETHVDVLGDVVASIGEAGLVIRGLTASPIKGPEGNIEFWIWASRTGASVEVSVETVVSRAHEELGGSQ